jgi:hypothetical protein
MKPTASLKQPRPEKCQAGVGDLVSLVMGRAQREAVLGWVARMSLRQVRPAAEQENQEDSHDRR